MRSEGFGIVSDNSAIEDFSKLRSKFHDEQRRARQL
jgi:hypothetical protein